MIDPDQSAARKLRACGDRHGWQMRRSCTGWAEQFVGQQLRALVTPEVDPSLYYWQRVGGRQGEIDYLYPHRHRIIPVEVKAGASGKMKSLHQFMKDKQLELAVRVDANPISLQSLQVKTTQGDAVRYRLLSVPFYQVHNLPALLDELIHSQADEDMK